VGGGRRCVTKPNRRALTMSTTSLTRNVSPSAGPAPAISSAAEGAPASVLAAGKPWFGCSGKPSGSHCGPVAMGVSVLSGEAPMWYSVPVHGSMPHAHPREEGCEGSEEEHGRASQTPIRKGASSALVGKTPSDWRSPPATAPPPPFGDAVLPRRHSKTISCLPPNGSS